MKFRIFLCIGFAFFVSCKQVIKEKDLGNLNGYWEIKKVILPEGEEKTYTINETIDFFKLKNKAGFRKKLMQQFDGSFLTNNVEEEIIISNEKGQYFINYVTNYAKWKEEILVLTKEKLVVKNKNDLEYHYKRPVLFTNK